MMIILVDRTVNVFLIFVLCRAVSEDRKGIVAEENSRKIFEMAIGLRCHNVLVYENVTVLKEESKD